MERKVKVLQGRPHREVEREHARAYRLRSRCCRNVHPWTAASRRWTRRGCIADYNKTGQLINQQLNKHLSEGISLPGEMSGPRLNKHVGGYAEANRKLFNLARV